MPQAPPKTPRALGDYAELLRTLAEAGFETVVIGGCAVGAYARKVGEAVFSEDLDLLASQTTLDAIVAEAGLLGLVVEKLPRPRNIPVAVFRWKGLEVNILTRTDGLPPADIEAQVAREFVLEDHGTFSVLVADPFDLLRNKLAVRRPKDEPHIVRLKRFVEEELVATFASAAPARERHAPVMRYLEVLQTGTLDMTVAERLIPLAHSAADFRMLAHRVPPELGPEVAARAREDIRIGVQKILDARRS